MTREEIPTQAEWGNYAGNVDAKYAHQTFFGKSRDEATLAFHDCVIERVDNLRWMPRVPFQYYMLAFRDFILSPELIETRNEVGNWVPDAASTFLDLIIEKLDGARDDIRPIMSELMATAEYVAAHQAHFRAKKEVYGNFGKKIRTIRRMWSA